MNERLTRASQPEPDVVGFFGKLPTHGDFVSTALGQRLQGELDRWIQDGLRAMEPALGKDWKRLFHAAPSWRFVVAANVWVPATIAGVFVPSRDRVGRSFPLIIAAQLRNFSGHPRDICEDDRWFSTVQTLAETIVRPDFDMQPFVDGIRRLGFPMPITRPGCDSLADNSEGTASLWWRMQPNARLGSGFKTATAPLASDFVKLTVPEQAAIPAPESPTKPPPAEIMAQRHPVIESLQLDSSHATHPGTRLSLNADRLLVSQQPSLFVIADGVADGTAAVEAARLTTTALSNIGPHDNLETLLQNIKGKLGQANGLLQAKTLAGENNLSTASVVVAAFHGEALGIVWAGDARCYLLRDGLMRSITRDHIDVGMRRRLACGVGLNQQFVPETLTEPIRGNDRIMLCSAPVSQVLADRVIAEILLETPLQQVSDTLIQEALIANCRENLSVIVIGVT